MARFIAVECRRGNGGDYTSDQVNDALEAVTVAMLDEGFTERLTADYRALDDELGHPYVIWMRMNP